MKTFYTQSVGHISYSYFHNKFCIIISQYLPTQIKLRHFHLMSSVTHIDEIDFWAEQKIVFGWYVHMNMRRRNNVFSFCFEFMWLFPFSVGNGSGPNSTALQCRDDPWRGSEWTRMIPAEVQKSVWRSQSRRKAPAFKPTRTDTTLWS